MTETAKRPYRMTARADAARATAEGILDATIAVFWERPTDEVSLVEIARRAGTTKQTVLRRFQSKDLLFAAAAERAFAQTRDERDDVTPGEVEEAVGVLVAHYERLGDGVLRLLAEEGRNPVLREIADRGRDAHVAWCERSFAPTLEKLRGTARRRRLAQLVAVCDVYMWKLLRRDRRLSRRQTEVGLRELLEPLTANGAS
jgi:AcrR family transcriptional regulator